MKYVSIDIESSGLCPKTNQILSVGAIVEDTEKQLSFEKIPKFYHVLDHKEITGSPYALEMNKELIQQIKNGEGISPCTIPFLLMEFLANNGIDLTSVVVAGKNFHTFDLPFLQNLPNWGDIKIHRRPLDPCVLFVDWDKDNVPPNLETCKERAGLEKHVSHNALEDAWDVIQLLRTKYENR